MRIELLFGVAAPEKGWGSNMQNRSYYLQKGWGTLGGDKRAAGKLPLKPAHTIVLQGVKFLPSTPA